MSGFLWTSGHLGWGLFALIVFTGLWVLLGDLVWRLKNVAITKLAAALAAGWMVGAAVIALAYCLASR